jgi:hypothetical protein
MGVILRCASDARIKIVLVCICFEFMMFIIHSSRNTPSPLNSHIISYSIFVYKTNIISVIICRNSNSGLFLRYSFANRSIHNANGTGSGHVELTATNGKRVRFLYIYVMGITHLVLGSELELKAWRRLTSTTTLRYDSRAGISHTSASTSIYEHLRASDIISSTVISKPSWSLEKRPITRICAYPLEFQHLCFVVCPAMGASKEAVGVSF